MLELSKKEKKKIFDRVLISDHCWEWTGGHSIRGYSTFVLKISGVKKQVRMHRIIYELLRGEIPENLVLDHLKKVCGNLEAGIPNRGCVNPWHLEAVTNGENSRRGNLNVLRASECPKGHSYTEDNLILYKKKNGQTHRKCKTCHKTRKATLKNTSEVVHKEFCKNWHSMTGSNVGVRKDGTYRCRQCDKDVNDRQALKRKTKLN
ncbi:MAG TPA: hypothetical protein PLP33_14500 [Leptospiraceae bacterium]|nr:hypothetical protein [Leptospiraceae bacterium]